MKANFVLTKDTVKLFIFRFNKMLDITGCIESDGIYTGRKEVEKMLIRNGFKRGLITPVVKTCASYHEKWRTKFDSYPSNMGIGNGRGLIIRITDDCCTVIKWGQKIKFTPNQIICIGDTDVNIANKIGRKKVFRIYHNTENAYNINNFEDRQAEAYWASVEYDFFNS